jgi:hypothetical protein
LPNAYSAESPLLILLLIDAVDERLTSFIDLAMRDAPNRELPWATALNRFDLVGISLWHSGGR